MNEKKQRKRSTNHEHEQRIAVVKDLLAKGYRSYLIVDTLILKYDISERTARRDISTAKEQIHELGSQPARNILGQVINCAEYAMRQADKDGDLREYNRALGIKERVGRNLRTGPPASIEAALDNREPPNLMEFNFIREALDLEHGSYGPLTK